MEKEEFIRRTKKFALRIIKLVQSLPKTTEGRNISNQLFRCGTSVAANYRAALRARSKAEFLAKLGIVEEECDETLFWIEILIETKIIKRELVEDLYKEAKEILAIVVATKKTTRKNLK